MKTINFRGITESLSDGEMKNVKGGLDVIMVQPGGGGGPGDCAFLACSCQAGYANPPFKSYWTDLYCDVLGIVSDINKICTYGGSCHAI